MTYPPAARRLARGMLLCLWAASLVPGCAMTAPATAWKPAEIEVDGMRQIAVLSFSGENGQGAAASLANRLWENEFYALVDQSELVPVRFASASPGEGVSPTDYLDSARTQGVDGLLVGDVIEYCCDDQVLTNTDIRLGTGHTESRARESDRVDVGVSHNQTIHREATVAIAFRLIEVETGKVRATRKTTRNFQGDFGPGTSPLPAKGEVLDELTEQCINEFVAMLAPHEVSLRLSLARSHLFQRGQALVGKGNDFAKRGRWPEALTAWNQALAANPDNDAALYNLALAHAAQHDYSHAEEFAIRAINLKHKDLYADGLEQIRQLAADQEKTLSQRQHMASDSGGDRHRRVAVLR